MDADEFGEAAVCRLQSFSGRIHLSFHHGDLITDFFPRKTYGNVF
jgi:hypothetical protein